VLPPLPAVQVFAAQPQYLDFENGSGIGFVTYYSQGLSPITSNDLFYTFQGLTNDGEYYVSIFYPVTTALLPATPEQALGGQSYEEWAKDYRAYVATLADQLNGLLPAGFNPNLTLIRDLARSVSISPATGATLGQ
jgi:hypothetical protein